jgi:hypothetical protein
MLALAVSLPVQSIRIRSLVRFGKLAPPSLFSALPRIAFSQRLYLNTFRGEPAISKFGWNFSPYHSSSPSFATLVSSVLHHLLRQLQPDHGKLTWFRVLTPATFGTLQHHALFRLAFASAPGVLPLTLQQTLTRRSVLQKVRHYTLTGTLTGCKRLVSGSISSPLPGYFSPFPHGTGSLSVIKSI